MRLLADESVEAAVVETLRAAGHDLASVAEESPGVDDDAVLSAATAADRILITNDKDFAELAFLQRKPAPGIVLLRMPRLRSADKAARVAEALNEARALLEKRMTVVDEHAVRSRLLPIVPAA